MKTRESPVTIILFMFMVIFLSSYAQAKIRDNTCSNCHTMHNSQNASHMQLGSTPQWGLDKGDCLDCHSTTRAVLLRWDCLGCHAKEINTNNNITTDGWPQIALNMGVTYLAGGNYKYVFMDDRYGHNVHGFGSGNIGIDSFQATTTPPGYDSTYDPSSGGYGSGNTLNQIMCAGQYGCHGNRDTSVPYIAMKATHHADDSMLKFGSIDESKQGGGSGGSDTTAAGKSYRFLYNVKGGEDSDWQATVSATDHNEYKGQTYASRPLGSGQSWANIDTISELCAECHGYFHASDEINNQAPPGGSPWKRHPTDVGLPAGGEYASYTAYSTEAPVARVNIPNSVSGNVNPGTDDAIVMCLSCHRAHASEYLDILRWDYSDMIAGDSSKSGGCFTCHTQKNTSP